MESVAFPVDVKSDEQMIKLLMSSVGTKFTSRYGDLIGKLALQSVRMVTVEGADGKPEIDVKKYAKVEKLPGGAIEDSKVRS